MSNEPRRLSRSRYVPVLTVMLACAGATIVTSQSPPDDRVPAVAGGFTQAWGLHYQTNLPMTVESTDAIAAGTTTVERVRRWNAHAVEAIKLDHTPDPSRIFGEQVGPARSARAMAIVHIAMFEALNGVVGGYSSYLGIARQTNTSADAAAVQAAYDTLIYLYFSQQSRFIALLAEEMATIPAGEPKTRGIAFGRSVAAAIIGRRDNDGSRHAEPCVGVNGVPVPECPPGPPAPPVYTPPVGPGFWSQDPVSRIPLAVGAFWRQVRPFALTSASQFRPPPPPALTSSAYTESFKQILRLGGDGVTTPTQRTPDQTIAGIYWAYDGTPGLGTPPRLYNQIAAQIARQRNTNAIGFARLMALLHTAMADAALSAWETKYHDIHWRPVTAVRGAAADGNPNTIADPDFSPLGSPASNLLGPNFTPPFPAYTSGHATLGGSVFQTLRRFYGTNNIGFTFVSDEFNGVTRDNQGNPRPRIPRTFSTLSQAEKENADSRIYLGVHWNYDADQGVLQGQRVANLVFDKIFKPL